MFVSHIKDFKLKFEYKEDGVKWYSLKYDLIFDYDGVRYIVPKSTFITDIASIPTLFQKWFKPRGKYSRSSVAHDFIVSEKHLSYFKKHWIYYKLMLADDVKLPKATLFYVSVVSFYWLHKILND